MNARITLIFCLTIVLPTACLGYFGFQAVRGEKAVIEESFRKKHRAMAGIVADEIDRMLRQGRVDRLLTDKDYLERRLVEQAALFPEVRILDRRGRPVQGQTEPGVPVFLKNLDRIPYRVGVYAGASSAGISQIAEKQRRYDAYVLLIIFSVFSILGGSVYILLLLAGEWRRARLKSAFVSQLSHDIRRPLTSIRMFTEMLEEDHLPNEDKRREYYQIISHESQKLTDLANSILDFSRLESGRMRYTYQTLDLRQVVQTTIKRFGAQVPSRVIKLIPRGDAPFLVKADAQAMEQVLMNLLSNADKYSPEDKPITVSLSGGPGRWVRVEVRDEGVGIARGEQKKIFQKFYRVVKKTGQVRGVEGTGLGLSLVRHIVKAHKGRITVISEEGKGSQFIIFLKK